jgi:DNA polymerase-3 subunit beta
MKFYCNQQDILNEIAFSMDFTQQRNSLSILSNVYLETRNNTLTIKATDTMMGFSTQIPVETVEEGNTTIFGEKFLDILKLLPNTKIAFETKDKMMTIVPEDSEVNFNSSLRIIDGSEFPALESNGDNPFFTVGQNAFISMADKTIFAVCTDDTRHYLCGLYLEKNETGMNLVATDGRRLSMVSRKFEEDIPDFKPILIPQKFFLELKKISTGEGPLDLCILENIIFAKIGTRFIYSTLVKGTYPDYRRVIPPEQQYHCTIKTKDMVDAIKRVSVSIENKDSKLYLDLHTNEIRLFSDENEFGKATERIDCIYEGDDCTICLNYQYLLSPLKVMESETFTLNFTNPTKAVTICPVGDFDYFHLVMPMQSGN